MQGCGVISADAQAGVYRHGNDFGPVKQEQVQALMRKDRRRK